MTMFDTTPPHQTFHQVAISVAPNGGRRTTADHPAIPLTAAAMARTAAECLDAGASMIHVHVRDADGHHLLDADAYRSVTAAIQAEVDDRLVVQITTESVGKYGPAEQAAVLKAVRPEAASLALRELAPDDGAEKAFGALLGWMDRENVLPQIILYEPSEAVRLKSMIDRGVVPWRDVPVLYVLGRYTVGQTSHPADLLSFLAPDMPRYANWTVCAFGKTEAACVTAGALLGGHVRVGFENNLFQPDGSVATSNAGLVATVHASLSALGLRICDVSATRSAHMAVMQG